VLNLETDIIGKYVERLMSFENNQAKPESKKKLSYEFLAENGF
jgi:riboflavin synthase alpha subunit